MNKEDVTHTHTHTHTHTMEYYSARQRQISYDNAYMWNLKKMIQINLYTKQKQTHRQKTNIWLPKGKGGGGGKN